MEKYIVTQNGATVVALSGGGIITKRKREVNRKDKRNFQIEFRVNDFEVVMGIYLEKEAEEIIKSFVKFLASEARHVYTFPESGDE